MVQEKILNSFCDIPPKAGKVFRSIHHASTKCPGQIYNVFYNPVLENQLQYPLIFSNCYPIKKQNPTEKAHLYSLSVSTGSIKGLVKG